LHSTCPAASASRCSCHPCYARPSACRMPLWDHLISRVYVRSAVSDGATSLTRPFATTSGPKPKMISSCERSTYSATGTPPPRIFRYLNRSFVLRFSHASMKARPGFLSPSRTPRRSRRTRRWAEIAKRLPGRTDNSVKNQWYSTVRHRVHELDGLSEAEYLVRTLNPAVHEALPADSDAQQPPDQLLVRTLNPAVDEAYSHTQQQPGEAFSSPPGGFFVTQLPVGSASLRPSNTSRSMSKVRPAQPTHSLRSRCSLPNCVCCCCTPLPPHVPAANHHC
jgi:hypothetical protein